VGIGGFSLPTRAYDSSQRQHTFQPSETSVLGKVVNETHFRFSRDRNNQNGDDSIPTLQVLDAFTGGGAQVGASLNLQDRWELQNVTSFTRGGHAVRAGLRFRTVHVDDVARQGFGGTVLFSGGAGPQLDDNGGIVRNGNGQPVFVPLTSLGLRYEKQDNIAGGLDLAPRAGFSWSVGKKDATGRARTIVRSGAGVFYDRFGEDFTLRALRFSGTREQQYVVTDPAVLDRLIFADGQTVAGLPSVSALAAFAVPQTTWRVAPNLDAPYSVQSSLGVERGPRPSSPRGAGGSSVPATSTRRPPTARVRWAPRRGTSTRSRPPAAWTSTRPCWA
jgi:hypothetical protein